MTTLFGRKTTLISVQVSCLIGATALAQIGDERGAKSDRPVLSNIHQLTTPEMGFEKAGEAYFSPDGASLIFQAVPKGKKFYQIYAMPITGGKPKMVSTGQGACTCGYFNPNGTQIIFASSHKDPRLKDPKANIPDPPGYSRSGSKYRWDFNPYMDIYKANLDGSSLTPLTSTYGYDAEGAYSKDGSQIAFSSNRDGSMNIYIMNADGSHVRRLTDTKDCYNGGPFLSPDGKRIIFRADRQKRDYLQIYVMDADGSNEIQLTDDDNVNWAPFWHPDGKTIVFTTSKHGHRNYEVYLMRLKDRRLHRVTNSPRFDGLPVFSPDGKRMMWTSQRGADGSSQVFVADFTMPESFRSP